MHKQTTSAEKSSILALIKDLMSKTEVVYTEEQLDKLATLVCLLSQWNNALNLTAIRDPKQMVVKHILDSAVVSPLIQNKVNNIADV